MIRECHVGMNGIRGRKEKRYGSKYSKRNNKVGLRKNKKLLKNTIQPLYSRSGYNEKVGISGSLRVNQLLGDRSRCPWSRGIGGRRGSLCGGKHLH